MSGSLPLAGPAARPARPEDAPGIVDVVRSGFSAAELDLMIYGCRGIQRFVALQLARLASGADTVYTVAEAAGGRVAACVELRLTPSATYLNYISVTAKLQASGLGRRVLLAALRPDAVPSGVISLDVFERNLPAIAWYERLGFERVSTGEWWSLPLPAVVPEPASPPAVVSGYPQAAVCHEAFGFSQVTLMTPLGSYAVGRIAERWLRLTDPAALADPGVPAVLRRLGNRRILAVSAPDRLGPDLVGGGQLLQRTFRMTAAADTVRTRLS